MSKMVKKGMRGFTLIEMLIVIVVIAILAMIVIPRLLEVGRKSKETALKNNLQQLRNGIVQFKADCGDYPAKLNDLMDGTGINRKGEGGNGILLNLDAWKGPYLKTVDRELPWDPFTGEADWIYDASSGDIHSASKLTALDGTKYSEW